ncbi:serine/threonine-protein kinase bud32 [Parahypoxylon ruwenzoriense]
MAADAPPRVSSPSQQNPQAHDPPLPTILTYPSSSSSTTPPTLIAQGAEARLYRTTYLLPSLPCALKYRVPKSWRHPVLDARLTRHRILAEARILAKCRREGVPVPAIYGLDENAGWMAMEWVDGAPARVAINAWLRLRREREKGRRGLKRKEREGEQEVATTEEEKEDDNRNDKNDGGKEGSDSDDDDDPAPVTGDSPEDADLVALLRRIASAVGRMHKTGIVHGDLTTSNMMLQPPSTAPSAPAPDDANLLGGDIVIIDFGLASQSTSDEDRAVDLYVLERAFASTHSRVEALFIHILENAYGAAYKQAPVVLKKLEEVRMRGRKRSMIG